MIKVNISELSQVNKLSASFLTPILQRGWYLKVGHTGFICWNWRWTGWDAGIQDLVACFLRSISIFVLDVKVQQRMTFKRDNIDRVSVARKLINMPHVSQEKKCAPLVDACFAEGFIYQGWGHGFYFFLVFSFKLRPARSKQLSGNRRSTGFGSLFVWVKFNIFISKFKNNKVSRWGNL